MMQLVKIPVLPGHVLGVEGTNLQINSSFWLDDSSLDVGEPRKPIAAPTWLDNLERFIEIWRRGQPGGVDLPLRIPRGFDGDVVIALQEIPYGQTRTYGELASLMGRPKAARAVAGGCGRNPFAFLVPCHRVVAARGLGGYSGGEGVRTKRLLLTKEAAWPSATPHPNLVPH